MSSSFNFLRSYPTLAKLRKAYITSGQYVGCSQRREDSEEVGSLFLIQTPSEYNGQPDGSTDFEIANGNVAKRISFESNASKEDIPLSYKTESVLLEVGQNVVEFIENEVAPSKIYVSGLNTDSHQLFPQVHYTIDTPFQLTLVESQPEGTSLYSVQEFTSL